jgi:hypothetical protein
MKTKLTLSIDKEVIEKARLTARRSGRSVSQIVEDHLRALAGTEESWARSVNGKLADAFSPEDFERNDRLGILLRKHMPKRTGKERAA